jgi:hypothetical protein
MEIGFFPTMGVGSTSDITTAIIHVATVEIGFFPTMGVGSTSDITTAIIHVATVA